MLPALQSCSVGLRICGGGSDRSGIATCLICCLSGASCGIFIFTRRTVFHPPPTFRSADDDGEDESTAQGTRQTHDNLYRVHMPSLYSCGSSYGSETSIPAAAHTVSNAPVTEYM